MAREQLSADANDERPSVALTARFLALCQQYGSEQLAVSIVAAGRSRRGAAVAGAQRLDGVERRRDARGRLSICSASAVPWVPRR